MTTIPSFIFTEGTISPPPPIASTPAYAAQSSGPNAPTFTSAHSSPSPPANPTPSIEPPYPLIPFPELYFYVGLGVVGLIAVSLIVAVTCCCICRIRKKHSQTCAAQSTPGEHGVAQIGLGARESRVSWVGTCEHTIS